MSDCVEVLKLYNAWRRGCRVPMPDPITIGLAIDSAILEIKQMRLLIQKSGLKGKKSGGKSVRKTDV